MAYIKAEIPINMSSATATREFWAFDWCYRGRGDENLTTQVNGMAPGWYSENPYGIYHKGEIITCFPNPMRINVERRAVSGFYTFPHYSGRWTRSVNRYDQLYYTNASRSFSGDFGVVTNRIDESRIIMCSANPARHTDYSLWRYDIYDLDSCTSEEYCPWISTSSGANYNVQNFLYVTCDANYLVFAMLDYSVSPTAYKLILASKANPGIMRSAQEVPEWKWLDDQFRTWTSAEFDFNGRMLVLRDLRSKDPRSYHRYLYIGIARGINSSYESHNYLMCVDSTLRTVRVVPAPEWPNAYSAVVDRLGILHYSTLRGYYQIDPSKMTVQAGPLRAQYRSEKYADTFETCVVGPWKVMVHFRPTTGTAQNPIVTSYMVVDAYNDTYELVKSPQNPTLTTQWRCGLDDVGGIWAVSPSMDGRLYPYPGGSNFYGSAYFGEFGSGALYGPPQGADLGKEGAEWGSLTASTLVGDTESIGTQEKHPMPVSVQGILDTSVDIPYQPYCADGAPEGAIPKAIGGRWYWVTDLNATQVPPEGADGDILSVVDGAFDAADLDATLPDWFSGCTPVVDNGVWRAGDALVEMPYAPYRDNVIWVSRGKRWDNAVIPFTCLYDTLAQAFPGVTAQYDEWPIYASGNYDYWAANRMKRVDGYWPGLIPPLIDPKVVNEGVAPEDWGVVGNFTDYNFTGDVSEEENKPFSLFAPVRGVGTGRWEVGDMLETLRKRVNEYDDAWHWPIETTTVNRVDDFEPGTLYGVEHEELFHMLGRFMSRMWMWGALTVNIPVVAEVQVSQDPTFATGVTDRITSTSVDGWWFQHTDGGHSPFLPTGPATTTVVAIAFDPRLAGVTFELGGKYFARWRTTISGVTSEWAEPEVVNRDTMWWSIRHIEDQTYVNHFVLPDMVERGWLRTKDHDFAHGGAPVFIPLQVVPGSTVDIEIEYAEGISFKYSQTRNTAEGKVGWKLIDTQDAWQDYPEDSVFDGTSSGVITVVFDPAQAFLRTRAGTHFYRYRVTVDGVSGGWTVKPTVTTESTMYRTDVASVFGMEADLGPAEKVAVGRYNDSATLVCPDGVEAAGVLDEEDWAYLNGSMGARTVTAIGHGVYERAPVHDTHYKVLRQLGNRRQVKGPPIHDKTVYAQSRGTYPTATYRIVRASLPYISYGYGQEANAAYAGSQFGGSQYYPGTDFVYTWATSISPVSSYLGLPGSVETIPNTGTSIEANAYAEDTRFVLDRVMSIDACLLRWQTQPRGIWTYLTTLQPVAAGSPLRIDDGATFLLQADNFDFASEVYDAYSGAFARALPLNCHEGFTTHPDPRVRSVKHIWGRGVNHGVYGAVASRPDGQPFGGLYREDGAIEEYPVWAYSGVNTCSMGELSIANAPTNANSVVYSTGTLFDPIGSGWRHLVSTGMNRNDSAGFNYYYYEAAVIEWRDGAMFTCRIPLSGATSVGSGGATVPVTTYVSTPGSTGFSVPIARDQFNQYGTFWVNWLDASVRQMKYVRTVQTTSGSSGVNCTVPVVGCTGVLYSKAAAYLFTATNPVGFIEVGDASPLMTFVGDKYARLEVGQHIGR